MKNNIAVVQEFLEFIAESMPGFFYWKDDKGNYLGCNNLLIKTLGFQSKDQLISKTDWDLWPEYAEELKQNDKNVMESNKSLLLEETIIIQNKKRYYSVIKTPWKDKNGNNIGIIGNSVEITELKETQHALREQIHKTNEANRSKSAFLSIATHEIRSPISNILGLINLTKDQLENLKDLIFTSVITMLPVENSLNNADVVNQFLAAFHEINQNLNETIAEGFRSLNSLENLSELHNSFNKSLEVKYEASTIKDFIQDAIRNSTYLNAKNIDFRINIDNNLSKKIVFDYNNMFKALRIIIGNAIRFSSEKSIVLVSAIQDRNNIVKNLVIKIQDFGQGISKEQLTNIFITSISLEETKQDSVYNKPSLQLPQAKKNIEASGGSISIESIYKKGTTVTINIPFMDHSDIDTQNVTNDKISIGNEFSRKKLLLVEDELITQKIIQNYLKDLGYYCDVASTGFEAIQMATTNAYDIILIDITLPDMKGYDVKHSITKKVGDTIPFVAITSHSSSKDQDFFESHGIVTVLKKPVTKYELKDCIEGVLLAKDDEDNDN